jgi:hypothetical protein
VTPSLTSVSLPGLIDLYVAGKRDSLSPWDGVLDLPEQTLIHNRSQQLIGESGLSPQIKPKSLV